MILDEEQRFGVGHKERIKVLKNNVDTITLTATPIPRTLHMSLIGIRDISLIDTAPSERLSVQTTVTEYSNSLVKSAIEKELSRSGQVLVINNRVFDIDKVFQNIKNMGGLK